jgi:FAD/FMN-containing dehydrogenase
LVFVMTESTETTTAARRLERELRGELHRECDRIVVAASSAADVRSAVLVAREHDLPLAVEATGHGTLVTLDRGIVVNTAAMAPVLVDPDRRVARVGPGAQWGAVIAAAAPCGLAPLAGSSATVGVAGYTFGGGMGWLARKHGFAADSLLRAEVVTADGAIVTASADEHADLFWALRGGGGNFGIATSLEVRLHPVARVYAGTAFFAIERAAATLARYRDWIARAPDELSTAVLLTRLPDGTRALAIRAMYLGHAAQAERLLAPLRAVAGPALVDGLRPTTFAAAEIGGTAPVHLDLFDDLPDAVIETLVAVEDATVEVRHWGGAIARPAAGAGPVGHRDVPLSVIVDADVPGVAAALAPHATGGSFLNFLRDPSQTERAYTAADYAALRAIKATYDPDNVFGLNHNIAPALPRAAASSARAAGAAR